MFEKFDEAARDVLAASRHETLRMRSNGVTCSHLLLALTRDPHNIAARALATMNIKSDNLQEEVEKVVKTERVDTDSSSGGLLSFSPYENAGFDEGVKKVLERSNDIRLFFGRVKIAPEHLLLALLDVSDEDVIKILEELGANLTFLRRQVLNFVAREDCYYENAPSVRATVIGGINEIVQERQESIDSLKKLTTSVSSERCVLPDHADLVLMVFLSYLPDFLSVQVAFQRYLLEQTIKLLHRRAGSLDKEVTATIVSVAAQNLRTEVRAIIENLWSHEYRLLSQMPDEAEHDLIGSVIEDLWWTHSEEIALHEVFDEALDDYRRKHVLNLQKRKLELAQRMSKLRLRLDDTIRQTFAKRFVSAS